MNNFLFNDKKNINKFFKKISFFVIIIFIIIFSFIYFYSLARGIEKNFYILDEQIKKIEIEKKDFENNKETQYNFQYPKVISEKIPKSPSPVLKENNIIFPDNFSAFAIIAKDKASSKLLFSKNIYEKRSIASITKLMSAIVLLEKEIDWDSSAVVIGADNLDTYIYAGEEYSLDQLWDMALVLSSNKAILTLINSVYNSEEDFVNRMNQKTKELGMLDTTFTDPTGLKDSNISTASDLVILLDEALKNEKIVSTLNKKDLEFYSSIKKEQKHAWNTNWLLLGWIKNNFFNLVGGKTGYINSSLYNFAVQIEDENNNIIDVVVLGAKSHEERFTEARDVADFIFTNYIWK